MNNARVNENAYAEYTDPRDRYQNTNPTTSIYTNTDRERAL